MFQYRDATLSDFHRIASFPRNRDELFYMYPKGNYPLTAEQLTAAATERKSLTVVTDSNEVVGYSNLYDVNAGVDCWIGNVIVCSESRGTGAASYLIQAMLNRAAVEHQAKTVNLVCHNTNTRALLFYHKLGFTPFDLRIIESYDQGKIAGVGMRKAVEGQVSL
ncbi:GNAT family N-acetyltransferase [Cohnella herbarum]|uniref:GNAT family N-acetyltransferase n=1 Tax=Cohnella herbarum TaxID=2728023 RepID=A0A7Z2ZJZ0_9BACL|nr:GNAT family N-acetyltransferase [Cohnella herbarum]QJD82671.1 GNAT family N-acetyltransferase [Cohnella herbarum]